MTNDQKPSYFNAGIDVLTIIKLDIIIIIKYPMATWDYGFSNWENRCLNFRNSNTLSLYLSKLVFWLCSST